MMQQIQAALFDLDGTLTNTLQDIADAMNRALLQHGLPTWTTEEFGAGHCMLKKVYQAEKFFRNEGMSC